MFDGAMEAVEVVSLFDVESCSDRSAYQNAMAPAATSKRMKPDSFRVDPAIPNIKQAQLLVLW